MNAPRRILVATDFSEVAGHAQERGALLAKTLGCELGLLHVVGQNRLVELSRILHEVIEDARRQSEEASAAALRAAAADIGNRHLVYPDARVMTGPVPASIIAAATEANSELLVVGARGDNPVRDFLLGSTAERVLRKNRRSMLVVRGAPAGGYRQVLVPVDFSPNSQAALRMASLLAPQATLTALHVFDAPFEGKLEFAGVSAADIENYRDQGRRRAEADLHHFLKELPAETQSRVVPQVAVGYAPGVILTTARALGADLIALGKHGRSPVEEWVLGSVTQHVLRHADCDVLAVDQMT